MSFFTRLSRILLAYAMLFATALSSFAQFTVPQAVDNELRSTLAQEVAANGDATAGAKVFFSTAANCQSCHRVRDYGGVVGPDLSKIGSERSTEELIESMLWPAEKVADKYLLTTVITDKGKSVQGFLISETSREIRLRDTGCGEVLVIPQSKVDDRVDGGTVMPDGLATRISREQLRDLTHFLSRLGKDPNEEVPLPKSLTETTESPVPDGFEIVDVELEFGTISEQMRYDKHWVRVQPGQKVKLTLKNTDRMQHNLLILDPFAPVPPISRPDDNVKSHVAQLAFGLGAEAVGRNYVPDTPLVLWNTQIVNPGQSASIYFVAPEREGDYPIVCTLPGHAQRMRSILHVGDGEEPPPPEIDDELVPDSAIERAQQAMKRYWRLGDLGPVFSGVIDMQESVAKATGGKVEIKTPTHKGIAVRLDAGGEGGDARDAAILFDMDLLRYSAGWTGDFINLRDGREDERAEYRHSVAGKATFFTKPAPGWNCPEEWTDERPRKLGPLPKEEAKYLGHHRHGDRVAFNYRVGDMTVLDAPSSRPLSAADANASPVITRSLQLSPTKEQNRLTITDAFGESIEKTMVRWIKGVEILWCELAEDDYLAVAVGAGSDDASFHTQQKQSRRELVIEAHEETVLIDVHIWRGSQENLAKFVQNVVAFTQTDKIDPGELAYGGPPQWDDTIITRGQVNTSDAPFVVDTLRLPFENPWNCLLYTSGLDFFENGDAALCTSHGDVWKVTGIDDRLERLQWRRIASGLSNPLGLKIVDEEIYVTCLDQLVRLKDLNDDEEIDFYECFNSDGQVSHQHHRFATGLETDSNGDFYYCKCTEEGATDHGGTVIRVSSDGKQFEVVATGLRNPNGIGIGPDDTISFGKMQGTWVPSSGIHAVTRQGFCGYMPAHHRDEAPDDFDKPLCWIPHGVDNASAEQVWVPAEKPSNPWNDFAGQMLHLSYGKCQLFLVLQEQVGGVRQGGVVQIPNVGFQSGAMRARFHPRDGQLYVTGLRGWQTSAGWAGCLQRVRYQGKNPRLPIGLNVKPSGVQITFSAALDADQARDVSNYTVKQWNYRWTKDYGSKDYKVEDPEVEGRDDIAVESVRLLTDGKTIFLEVPGIAPVMQMMIDYDLTDTEGNKIAGPIFNTINQIPNE